MITDDPDIIAERLKCIPTNYRFTLARMDCERCGSELEIKIFAPVVALPQPVYCDTCMLAIGNQDYSEGE